jgi:folate-binding protein YgfZ
MKTPLYEVHRTHGAQFTEYQGWELPDQFTDPTEEYRAVRDSVGLMDVSYRATFQVSGPDRADFLHRILSHDVKSLRPGAGCHAALLTPQGKLIGVMKVLATEDTILLETEPAARPTLFDRLELYKLAQKVELNDVTETFVKLLVQGPKATELLRAVVDQELAVDTDLQHRELFIGLSPWSLVLGPWLLAHDQGPGTRDQGPIRLIRVHETGEEGYELIAPAALAPKLWEHLFQTFQSAIRNPQSAIRPVGLRAFNMLRVEAGLPWYGVDMDDTNFPQEARLDHVLDWNKGCYVGQEPVARIKYRGHVNKRLAGLITAGVGAPAKGDRISKDDREIGRVTSAVFSPHLNCPIALGYVRREFLDPGTEVAVETTQGPATAIVTELPFYERPINYKP